MPSERDNVYDVSMFVLLTRTYHAHATVLLIVANINCRNHRSLRLLGRQPALVTGHHWKTLPTTCYGDIILRDQIGDLAKGYIITVHTNLCLWSLVLMTVHHSFKLCVYDLSVLWLYSMTT
jgi:hypothetical protein